MVKHVAPAISMLRSDAIQRWWPTTQSLDLVEGTVEAVASAVEAEVERCLAGERLASAWIDCPSFSDALREAREFANVPTLYLVLPTTSRWCVLWNNSFLCDGYDSLCFCLTANHGLTTVHWSAHDEPTTFQAGATFRHRRRHDGAVVERAVAVAQEDRRWLFHQSGEPLPEEDVGMYAARRKKDRLNESLMVELLARLGASPWQESFYALSRHRCHTLRRLDPPPTVIKRLATDVVGSGRKGHAADPSRTVDG